MSSALDGYVKVCAINRLRVRKCVRTEIDGQAIAIFYHDGKVNAVHNRCPHNGYPLETGTVKEGVVTCMWHQARFDLNTGESFDQELSEGICTYAVQVVEGEVWVNPEPREFAP